MNAKTARKIADDANGYGGRVDQLVQMVLEGVAQAAARGRYTMTLASSSHDTPRTFEAVRGILVHEYGFDVVAFQTHLLVEW